MGNSMDSTHSGGLPSIFGDIFFDRALRNLCRFGGCCDLQHLGVELIVETAEGLEMWLLQHEHGSGAQRHRIVEPVGRERVGLNVAFHSKSDIGSRLNSAGVWFLSRVVFPRKVI